MDKSCSIIKRAVLFHPELDELNKYSVVVYNWKTGSTLKVNKFGYQVLKVIDDRPELKLAEIVSRVAKVRGETEWQTERKVRYFLDKMVNENVVAES